MNRFNTKIELSVIVQTYNNANTIAETVRSILNQSFNNFELLILDDKSKDNTLDIINTFSDNRIKIYKNENNLGCGANLNTSLNKASGDIIFYTCADDILDINALKIVHDIFLSSEEIGIVIRPYYWFEKSYTIPVRATRQFKKREIVSINSPFEKIRDVIALADQLSGVGFRKKHIKGFFGLDPFVETAYIVANTLKYSRAVILEENIIAVRINSNGSMSFSSYKKSPVKSWHDLIINVFNENKFIDLQKYLIKNFVANNFIGLVQIKNYGGYKCLMREILYMIKFRWQNILDPRFILFSLGTALIPRYILKKMVTFYKNYINNKLINISVINTDI